MWITNKWEKRGFNYTSCYGWSCCKTKNPKNKNNNAKKEQQKWIFLLTKLIAFQFWNEEIAGRFSTSRGNSVCLFFVLTQ